MRKIWLISVVMASVLAGLSGIARAQAAEPQVTADDRILGKADAPVTIIEYASLTCPHCAAFEKEILPKIKTEWIDTGKAKLVFRDFPLDGSALKAAIVARCAPPERFYGFIGVLFAQQGTWGIAQDPVPGITRIAKLGGMSDDQVQACLKDDALQNKLLAGRLAAEQQYQVESTPTFFINGKKVVGAKEEDIIAAIKSAASKA
ncbi:MAG TPA: thioredoxin domain-containing protein [Stellaceae bacterium]|nr:thioredoxin domain-containing protein [Stellaceae bacterium]